MSRPNQQLAIICVDDQPEVLAVLVRDLQPFSELVDIVDCVGPAEADQAIEDLAAEGVVPAVVICDHVMPHMTGMEWMTTLHDNKYANKTKKLLVTGQASYADTIRAINEAHIDRYLAKPWDVDSLRAMVRSLLTAYVLENSVDYQEMISILDQFQIQEHIRKQIDAAGRP